MEIMKIAGTVFQEVEHWANATQKVYISIIITASTRFWILNQLEKLKINYLAENRVSSQ